MAAASTGKLRRGEATMDKRLYRRGLERGNVAVWVWDRGGTLQRSRTPRNGDVWQI